MRYEIPINPEQIGQEPVEELRAWLALWRVPGIGPRSFALLLDAYPNLRVIFELSERELEQFRFSSATIKAIQAPDWASVDADLRWLEVADHHLLRLGHPGYPARLATTCDAPPLLFVHGNPACLELTQLAMVGSRNPTRGGEEIAFDFAGHLSAAGFVVTSGLALGIDAATHRGTLAANGITIAVTGTGLDRVYPARHRELAHAIVERGALVSEFPPGTPAKAENFPRRNRIISGLSVGTLVVEASLRSGSLITTRYALEQGREIFAIPGSIHNPLSKGCHALIRQGAKLVESVSDILEEFPQLWQAIHVPAPVAQETVETSLDEDYMAVLDALGHDPVPLEAILLRTGLTPAVVSSILLMLELKGYVNAAPGGRYSRTGKKDVN